MGHEESIYLMRTIYIWEANGLYMGDRPSVFSLQTVCFSFIRVVCICVLRCQPVKCRYSFASFRSSLQRGGNMAFSLCIKSKVSKWNYWTGRIISRFYWDILILIDKERINNDDFNNVAYPLVELGWKIGAMINPLLYTYSDWQKRNFTPFYKNVEQESIEICR